MVAALPTQQQVDRIAQDFAPDVVRIRFSFGRDWSGDPAIFFRTVLSDDASRPERLGPVTRELRNRLYDELGLSELDHYSYFNVRSQSEVAKLHDTAWD
jgi:hypothetical protein